MPPKKPKGDRYRYLTMRDGVIYYQREFGEQRVRYSLRTDDWAEAASARELYESRRKQRRLEDEPAFEQMADRYLKEGVGHLAGTTREDRLRQLGPGGVVRQAFEGQKVGDVTRRRLYEWWLREVEGKGRSVRTGLDYLSALSGVFGHAVDLEILDANPVDSLRGTLRRKRRTKQGRADEERDTRKPIETAEQLFAFVNASRAAYDGRLRNGRSRRQR